MIPEVVRNSNENDYLLDPMIGGGTTAIECKLLNRNLLALDINPNAIEITKNALDFESEFNPKIKLELNDSRSLAMLNDESIDFILNHPPYVDIIHYSEKQIPEDLSNIHDLDEFCDEIEKVAKEFYRVLKKDKYCAILIGDTRRNKMYQPLAFKVMERFLKVGFELKKVMFILENLPPNKAKYTIEKQPQNIEEVSNEEQHYYEELLSNMTPDDKEVASKESFEI